MKTRKNSSAYSRANNASELFGEVKEGCQHHVAMRTSYAFFDFRVYERARRWMRSRHVCFEYASSIPVIRSQITTNNMHSRFATRSKNAD